MTRYAIYYCPAATSDLWQFGSAILGYDSYNGIDVTHPKLAAISTATFAQWSKIPRRYGFHATLKAPFYLRDGLDETDVAREVAQLARRLRLVEIGCLTVTRLGKFIALASEEAPEQLRELASACVDSCEDLRAPIKPNDRERRLSAGLSLRQLRYLDEFGYPYVHDEFRFHMTLTGPLEDDEQAKALTAMRELYCAIDAPVELDAITLARQEPGQPFVLKRRFTLG